MVTAIALHNGHQCFIDDEDVAIVLAHPVVLHIGGGGKLYATHNYQENGRHVKVLIHRLILQPPSGMEVDHIDGNGLNNRRSNLRPVTKGQNCQNLQGARKSSKTGIRGVCWDVARGRYRAYVKVGRRIVWSRRFGTIEEAEIAVRIARQQHMTHSPECSKDARLG